MPDQHRLFFAQLPFLVAATTDETGGPVATLLTGEPGFAASPDPRTLAIAAATRDPAGRRLVTGAPIGLLGIEPHTRRRNRANGRVMFGGDEGLGLGVAYGIWAASGVALTAIASKALFQEPLTPLMMGGIVLIIGGVLLVEVGAAH